jgi:hypothetical protein
VQGLLLHWVSDPKVALREESAEINISGTRSYAKLVSAMVPVAIEVRFHLLDHSNLRCEIVLLRTCSLRPNDDSSIRGATQKKIRDRMPFKGAYYREKLFEHLDLGPLSDVRGATGFENPYLVISWTNSTHGTVSIPRETGETWHDTVC